MVKETRLYEILGIAPESDGQEIKQAYRKMAKKFHPDKNKDAGDVFKDITMAHEVLSDPEKRELYDKFGEEGLREGGPGGFSAEDVFAQFFGGGGGGFFGGGGGGRRGGRPQQRKGEDLMHPLKVTLEDLYRGKTSKLALQKSVLCTECAGKGAKSGTPDALRKCATCSGAGVKITLRQLGPGMVQQLQQTCPDCHGEGEVIKDSAKCTKCKGQKVVQEKKVLEVFIDRGMRHGQKIVFAGEADQAPGVVPGDIIVVLQQKEHPVFTRDGPDLYLKHDISLYEALCGFEFPLTHLDDRTLIVRSNPGDVVRPGDRKSIEGEGMPTYKRPFEKGLLIIEFNVIFPPQGSIPQTAHRVLEKVLPKPAQMAPPEGEVDEVVAIEFNAQEYENQRNRRSHEDDDEDGGGHPQGVSCSQQ